MLPSGIARHTQLGVYAALPMHMEMVHRRIIDVVQYNLYEHCTQDALAQADVGIWMVPSRVEISTELMQTGSRFIGQCLDTVIECGDSRFQFRRPLERLVPAPLQFIHNKPIVRVHGIVLPLGSPRLELCAF